MARILFEVLHFQREIDGELSALARELTVGETYFFRHSEQFDALRELVLPERSRARQEQRTLRLLSVGCASGEEAYTLAMLILESERFEGWDVRVIGTDLSKQCVTHARRGVYQPSSLRATSMRDKARYFFELDDGFHVHVAEQRDFFLHVLGNRAVAAAQQNVGLDTDGPQFLHAVLRRFGLELLRRADPGDQRDVHETRVIAPELVAELR